MTEDEKNLLRAEGAMWMLKEAVASTHIHGRTIERLTRAADRQFRVDLRRALPYQRPETPV